MLNFTFLNPILVHIFTSQILISIMGKYSKEFRSMKKRSNCIFKSFLIVLFIISIVHMSESNVEDVTEASNAIETENLQSNEEKTEEPIISQIAYFQGTETSAIQQDEEFVPASIAKLNSNRLLSFIPNMRAAGDDDDSEQNDAQESFLIAETGIKGNTKVLNGNNNPMIRFLRGNRMLIKQQLLSNEPNTILDDDKDSLMDDPSKNRKLYLSEVERMRGYLPNLMKLKRLVKKCQCSYRDEDQYSSIKDAIFPNRVDHNRINLDYLDNEDTDEDDKDEDDDSQPSDILRQRNYKNSFNKYKRFDSNPNFREDDEMDADDEDDFEKFNKFNENKSEEDQRVDDLDPFDDILADESSEESLEEEIEQNVLKDDDQQDQLNNNNSLNNQDIENSKLLSPFMTNMSPTSSSDIIFNEFSELSLQTNQLDETERENEENEIQLSKLRRVISDGSLNANNSDPIKLQEEFDLPDDEEVKSTDEMTNPLVGASLPISSHSTQYSTLSMSNNRGGGSRVGGNKSGGRNNKRNLLDHLILNRKRRQANKSSKSQLQGMKKGNSNSKSGRN